ncbi:MAG: hypothetical protein DRI77_15185 [Chloroflexi bacterium]|nr:MAG: hypothetical protein DRI77_15185 [Chloroflexota bacterium]
MLMSRRKVKVFVLFLLLLGTLLGIFVSPPYLGKQGLAMLVGAVCGVGVAIPTSLLIVAVSRRRDERREPVFAPQGVYPPVIVVAPQERQSAGAAESRSGELEFKGRGVGQRVTKQEEEE